MIAASARVFVDTNVLVYVHDSTEPEKQALAYAWYRHLWQSRQGRLSVQVLNEYYHTVTRKLKPGRSPALARKDVQALQAWKPIPVQLATIERAWRLQDRYSLSYWDALIVASAGLGGCEILLSEDLQDGQSLEGLVVLNPFSRGPHDLS